MTREEARRRTDEFKAHTEGWLAEFVSLYLDQVWWALGYDDWDEYCRAEFGAIRLPAQQIARDGAIITLRQTRCRSHGPYAGAWGGVGTVQSRSGGR